MEFLCKVFIKDYKNTKDPRVKKKYGLLASVVGIISNVILFVAKIIIALISGSVSIISDAFNNLSDASSSIITLIGFKISSKPADREHPFGYQRMEYICAFIVSFIILFIGIELGISSLEKIINPMSFTFNNVMLGILILTIFIKLWLGLFYKKISKKIDSLSLKANSKDSINDVVTTSVIIIGLLIGNFFDINIDGYLGVLVCVYIIIGGVFLIKETVNKLIGGAPNKELLSKIRIDLLKEEKIMDIHDVLYHQYGLGKIYVSLHAEMDSSLSLVDAHGIVDNLEKKIKKDYEVELLIHIDPVILNDELLTDIHKIVKPIIKNIDNILSFHELKVKIKKGKTIICFDLQVPYDFRLSNEEIYTTINKKLKKINNNYRASITFDKV